MNELNADASEALQVCAIKVMTSSLREASLDETLVRAKRLAAGYGIVRVTDITRLDKIGIPVFASIRPQAEENSLCVCAGKGIRTEEARVGAYMEAIEFAAAEAHRNSQKIVRSTPREIDAQDGFLTGFVDFCPLIGLHVEPDISITCAAAEDVQTGTTLNVPAELVFFPYNENPEARIFGTSTNGLCSGNTVDEATLHGLCEVLERDTQALNFVHDSSVFVRADKSTQVEGLIDQITEAGLTTILRYTPNIHGLPYFQAFILEPNDETPISISHGTGCHPCRDIAAVRALTEAAQSRLSYIHGGRDDLIERSHFFASQEASVEARETARMRARVTSEDKTVDYFDIPNIVDSLETGNLKIKNILEALVRRLADRGFPHVLRTVLAQNEGLAVVRVMIPKAESFEPSLKRAGPRLLQHVRDWR